MSNLLYIFLLSLLLLFTASRINKMEEFQAVVLAAGTGSRMSELNVSFPKCLLPVGPKPLIWYPLRKLEESGFTEAFIIVAENHNEQIHQALNDNDMNLRIRLEYVAVSEDTLGTADSLRCLHGRIKTNFLVISCDLITDVNLLESMQVFRQHSATVVSLFFNHQQPQQRVIVPGPKVKHKSEEDLIGVEAHTNRLVFLASAGDFDQQSVGLSRVLLRKFSNLQMYSQLTDGHVYIMRHWIIDYLVQQQPTINGLKSELLPHIVRKQLLPQRIASCIAKENPSIVNDETFNHGTFMGKFEGLRIQCYAQIIGKTAFGIRVNTTAAYWYANQQFSEVEGKLSSLLGNVPFRSPGSEIASKQVDETCVVWSGAQINEKSACRRSLIGANVKIGKCTRVMNSILMHDVIIKDRVTIVDSIVCNGAVIEVGCQFSGCIVGSSYTVSVNSVHKNEVLMNTHQFIELE